MAIASCWASSGRSGRGPTRLMCPINTLRNWGISSSRVRRNIRPTRVIRGSSLSEHDRPRCTSPRPVSSTGTSASGTLEIVDADPRRWDPFPTARSWPARRWRMKMSPGDSTKIAMAMSGQRGRTMARPSDAPTKIDEAFCKAHGPRHERKLQRNRETSEPSFAKWHDGRAYPERGPNAWSPPTS